MQSNEPRVMAAVSGHWLVGAMLSAGTRIQDVLNDGSTDFVHLMDVQVCGIAQPESCLATLSKVLIPKCKIQLVILPADRHEAPKKRWNNLTVRATTNVFTIVSKYRIQGELNLPTSSDDPLSTLTHQLGRFFPITQASLSGPGVKELSVPVLLANRDFVNCFHVGKPANVASATGVTATASSRPEESDSREENLMEMLESFRSLLGEGETVSGTDLKANSPAG